MPQLQMCKKQYQYFVIAVENVTISDSDFIVYRTFAVNVSNYFLSRYLLFVDLKI